MQSVASGEPIVLGTGIMVRTVVEQYRLGGSIEHILWDFPQLSSAQVHDALSYYHDHKEGSPEKTKFYYREHGETRRFLYAHKQILFYC